MLDLRPLQAGLILTPIYLVMMVGSPVAGAVAERVGGHRLIMAGLAVYAAGLWFLGGINTSSAVFRGVLAPVAVFAVGMAAFTSPLASATMSALADADQGIASGVNNAMGQLAGLLAIVAFPALAGLDGTSRFTGAEFAAAYPRALHAAALMAALAVPIAALTQRPRTLTRSKDAMEHEGAFR